MAHLETMLNLFDEMGVRYTVISDGSADQQIAVKFLNGVYFYFDRNGEYVSGESQ